MLFSYRLLIAAVAMLAACTGVAHADVDAGFGASGGEPMAGAGAGQAVSSPSPSSLASHSALPLPLVVLVDTGTHMPLAELSSGILTAGVHRDVGAALADRMGRKVQFRVWPRKRIGAALEQGEGDILCLYMPEWLPGKLHWSQPFFPLTEVVITSRAAPRPQSLADLADPQIGSVLGYVYPELEQALGSRFVRADTGSGLNSLRKLELGRVRHAETTTLFLDYFLKEGGKLEIHPPLVVRHYRTVCAVSPRGNVDVEDVNRAIAQLLHDGGLNKILASYR